MKRFFYVLWQWLWGLPQNLVGLVIYLRYIRCPHFHYQGATVTVWPVRSGSMSMGQFLFLHPTWTPDQQSLLAHEYGHTIQSLLLGPLYLLIIGLPSVVWAGLPAFQRLRRQKAVPYSALYTEKWADHNGAKYAKKGPGRLAAAPLNLIKSETDERLEEADLQAASMSERKSHEEVMTNAKKLLRNAEERTQI